jgi:hypothetical protein
MPGTRGTAIVAAAVIAALFAIAGCGGDDGEGAIPQEASDEMLAATAEIEEANAAGDCELAQQRTTDLRNLVSDLGDGQVKRSLDAMVTRLDENLDDDCQEEETGTTDTEEEPEEPTTSVPVEPTTTFEETTTTTEPPPEEEEEPSTPEQPPGEGGGPSGPTPGGGQGGGGGGAAPPTGGIEE